MPHSYAMYGYAGYAKFGYDTWLRHIRLCRLRHRLRHIVTLHTELRHSASLRHPASLLVSLPRHSTASLPRHSSRHSTASLLAAEGRGKWREWCGSDASLLVSFPHVTPVTPPRHSPASLLASLPTSLPRVISYLLTYLLTYVPTYLLS